MNDINMINRTNGKNNILFVYFSSLLYIFGNLFISPKGFKQFKGKSQLLKILMDTRLFNRISSL